MQSLTLKSYKNLCKTSLTNYTKWRQLLLLRRTPTSKEIDAEQEMNKWGLAQPEVQVNHIGGTKFWIKIVFQKKRGGLTKLMEAISVFGFDITDTSITTSDGAVLVTLSAEGIHGGLPEADKIKKFLLEVISNI
ncbi:UNVERIFIED_CONTAM: Transcription factor DYT1 [Sesamum angustifolium]|uniref:Transcription factor DYT1 n=1 Tax=Sesamum angustifolium TaxID=2727405 RepID=A0AAW2PAY1_9LAMI